MVSRGLIWSEPLCPPQIHNVETLIPNMMHLELGPFVDNWSSIWLWEWCLYDEINALFWRDEEPWVSLLPKCKPGRGPSFRTDLWIQDFRTVRNICYLSHPVYGILLEQFKQTRTESAIQSNILHVNIRNFSFFQPLLGLADSEWCSREPHGLIPWSLFRMPRCAAISLWGKYLQRVLPVSILESSFSQI